MVEIRECDGRFGAAPSGAPTIAFTALWKPFAERRQVLSEGAHVVYRGPPFALKRAFNNLVENAIKYATPAEVELRRDTRPWRTRKRPCRRRWPQSVPRRVNPRDQRSRLARARGGG
jgi:hypothetical protein